MNYGKWVCRGDGRWHNQIILLINGVIAEKPLTETSDTNSYRGFYPQSPHEIYKWTLTIYFFSINYSNRKTQEGLVCTGDCGHFLKGKFFFFEHLSVKKFHNDALALKQEAPLYRRCFFIDRVFHGAMTKKRVWIWKYRGFFVP